MNLTGQQIWDALNKDPEFLKKPENEREVSRPFIEAIPSFAQDQLDLPFNLQNLLNIKISFLKYCSEKGFINDVIDTWPEEKFFWFSKDYFKNSLNALFENMLSAYVVMANNIPKCLKKLGVNEEEFLNSEDVGLNEETRNLYVTNELTIGKLLELQPMVIIQND